MLCNGMEEGGGVDMSWTTGFILLTAPREGPMQILWGWDKKDEPPLLRNFRRIPFSSELGIMFLLNIDPDQVIDRI